MDYKIIAVDTAIGQLSVAFLDSNGATVAIYAVDVPIVDGNFITGEALEAEIQQRAPVWLMERTAAINTVTNLAHLESLVDHTYVDTTVVFYTNTNTITITDILTVTTTTARSVLEETVDVNQL